MNAWKGRDKDRMEIVQMTWIQHCREVGCIITRGFNRKKKLNTLELWDPDPTHLDPNKDQLKELWTKKNINRPSDHKLNEMKVKERKILGSLSSVKKVVELTYNNRYL